MKVLHLNHSDINGGAARAAYRIHHALRSAGIDSRMCVNVAAAGDWTVDRPQSKWDKLAARLSLEMYRLVPAILQTGNRNLHSLALTPSHWVKKLNASDADLIHLHWVAGEMLSIADVGRINKPVVWTLHDMWAFCGAEHYTDDQRWREGYRADNRPAHESRFDLNRWTWKRKRKHWRRPMHIVAPSQWLADCARESALMRDWPVRVIHNALDTERWSPLPRDLARELLGLPPQVPLLLFGAMGGGRDPRKGFDLLIGALEHLRFEPSLQGLELLVFGEHCPERQPAFGFPIHFTGHLQDDLSLRVLYSAVDVMVIPSRQDNLPNTAVEAQACGTPVVAFDVGGLSDIVAHQRTGYLAKPFDTQDLARGIVRVLGEGDALQLSVSARQRAVSRFDAATVASAYGKLYAEILSL